MKKSAQKKKIVILSLGGSVGKTLIVTQCLYPHLPAARILCVDQANDTAADFGIENCESHHGDDFNKTYRSLMSSQGDVIVDVGGAKESREFMAGMLAIDGSDAITTFIIPSKPNSKDQGCAEDTINDLILGGVDKEKIKVVFTGTRRDTAEEFKQLISGMKENGLIPNLDLTIFFSQLFNEMIQSYELISDLLIDETDYKEKAEYRAEGDETDYIGKLMRQKMAKKVWPNLLHVYEALFLKES